MIDIGAPCAAGTYKPQEIVETPLLPAVVGVIGALTRVVGVVVAVSLAVCEVHPKSSNADIAVAIAHE